MGTNASPDRAPESRGTDSIFARYMHPFMMWTAGLVLFGALRDEYVLVDAFDTGLYLQWLYGFFTEGSLASSVTGERNFLAHHFQPLALLFAPLAGVFARPVALFVVSAAAVLAAWSLCRARFKGADARWVNGVFFVLVAQPAVAGRIWYGFVPDILALPAFLWMATELTRTDTARTPAAYTWQKIAFWTTAFLVAGGAKETFWLTNAAVALVACAMFQGRTRVFFAAAAVAQVVLFFLLFFWWMPGATTSPSYYGLSFYLPADVISGGVTFSDFAAACLNNLFSARSLTTLAMLVLLTCGLPFIRWTPVCLAGLPGLLAVLCARDPQLHHPANHYLIPVLPFLLAPAFFGRERYQRLLARLGRGVSPVILALVPAAFVALMSNGLVEQAQIIATHPDRPALREAAQKLKLQIPDRTTPIILEGIMQPLFFEYTDTTALLGHVGNPKQPQLDTRQRETILISSVDLKQIDDCRAVQVGGTQLRVDYGAFITLCEVVGKEGTYLTPPANGLVAYRLAPTTGTSQ